MKMTFYRAGLKLYSGFTRERSIIEVPADYKEIADLVIQKIGWRTKTIAKEYEYPLVKFQANKKMLIGLSGGLDSVYLMHKAIDAGYEVTAVHVAGLNGKSIAKVELASAQRLANIAGANFISVNFMQPPQEFIDNPFKNQLILSMMLDIGITKGIYRYGLGSDWTTPLSEAATGYTITDSIEVNKGFWNGVVKHIPEAELCFINENEKKYERLKYLFTNHRESLENVVSCISPIRFRGLYRKQNIKKYGVDLLPGRCGSCYKCCMEYILLAEAQLIKKDARFYEHCWTALATSQTAHRPDLFSKNLPHEKRLENLLNYGS